MHIGLTRHAQTEPQSSLFRVFGGLERAARSAGQVVLAEPSDYTTPEAMATMARRLVLNSDVVVLGLSAAQEVTIARLGAKHQPRLYYLTLGELPRGAFALWSCIHGLRSNDLVVFNCAADESILRRAILRAP